MSERDVPASAEPERYVSHNFDAMNRAIDNQVQKQELMSIIYRTQRYEKGTRTFFYVIASVCLLVLTGAILWWLTSTPGIQLAPSPLLAQDEQALLVLSEQEQITGDDAGFINTSFTVFHRNLTPSGDYVVTGKTYAPENLRQPYEQYCYLESAGPSGELAAKPLASYDETDFKLETEDAIFVKLVERFCRFTL